MDPISFFSKIRLFGKNASITIIGRGRRLLLYFFLTVCTTSEVFSATYTLESDQWQQLVVPVDSGTSSVSNIFADVLPADQYGNTWFIIWWNNETSEYVNPRLEDNIPTGQGFWMIQTTGGPVTLDTTSVADSPLIKSSACPSPDGCTEVSLFSAGSTTLFGMIGSAQSANHSVDSMIVVAPGTGGECEDGCTHSEAVEAGLIDQSIMRYNPANGSYDNVNDIGELGPWESAWFLGTSALRGLSVKYLFPDSGAVSACTYTNPNDPDDDPNPPYDGNAGRYPVSSNAIPFGFPTPLTTGICGVGLAAADLTPSDGITITTDGTVIDMQDITGNVKVMANDVTIKRSRITGTGYYTLQLDSGFSNLTVEDTRIRTINPPVPDAPAVLVNGSATFTRVHISGGSDSMKSNSGNLIIEDSYLTGTYRSPGSHNDVLQVRQGDNYQITGNTMLAPYQMSTSAFLFQAKAGAGGGPISNVLIENNYLSGGAYTGYSRAPDFPMTNFAVRNNVFEADSSLFGYKSDNAGANWQDNFDSNGVRLD